MRDDLHAALGEASGPDAVRAALARATGRLENRTKVRLAPARPLSALAVRGVLGPELFIISLHGCFLSSRVYF